jgi:hypothetical protein
MLLDQYADAPQLMCREPEVPCEGDGLQPEFRRQVVAVNVHVRRLIRFMAEEVHAMTRDRVHSSRPSALAHLTTNGDDRLNAMPLSQQRANGSFN